MTGATTQGGTLQLVATANEAEEWRDVADYVGAFQVSSFGRVRSLDRVTHRSDGHVAKLKGRIKPPTVSKSDGYARISLRHEWRQHTYSLSGLVAATFLGARPAGMEVCHNDGNKCNNRLDNLRYDTPVANAADRKLHGTHYVGEDTTNAKLDSPAVLQARKLLAAGVARKSIAERFNVSVQCIRKIDLQITWRHLL